MKKNIAVKTCFFIAFMILAPSVFAQKPETTAAQIRNPFIPQLPKKAEIVAENPVPVPDNTSKIPIPKPVETKPGNTIAVEPKAPPLPQPNFTVTGIIWNTDRPQAIINGQVVDIGDMVQEFKIESINQTAIEVSIQGVKMTVKP